MTTTTTIDKIRCRQVFGKYAQSPRRSVFMGTHKFIGSIRWGAASNEPRRRHTLPVSVADSYTRQFQAQGQTRIWIMSRHAHWDRWDPLGLSGCPMLSNVNKQSRFCDSSMVKIVAPLAPYNEHLFSDFSHFLFYNSQMSVIYYNTFKYIYNQYSHTHNIRECN